jgi:hypothetical protein
MSSTYNLPPEGSKLLALPAHGRIACALCHSDPNHVKFEHTTRTEGNWRIIANPLAWGNENPEVLVLGFSKGPTQAGALATFDHNEIAYKGGRGSVGKILAHLGLIGSSAAELSSAVSNAIADTTGRFHFGSLSHDIDCRTACI